MEGRQEDTMISREAEESPRLEGWRMKQKNLTNGGGGEGTESFDLTVCLLRPDPRHTFS